MLHIECSICQHTFEAPISKPGELSFAKCKNVFTMNYTFKLRCPQCKSILNLQKTGENKALGSKAKEQDSGQEKTQMVTLDQLQGKAEAQALNLEDLKKKNAPNHVPETKKVKIKLNLDAQKPLTDPHTAQVPEIISEQTKVKPFKILPQFMQKDKNFKLELKDSKKSGFSLNSNQLLGGAIALCAVTLCLFVFSLFKEKPLHIEDQTITQHELKSSPVQPSEREDKGNDLRNVPSIHDQEIPQNQAQSSRTDTVSDPTDTATEVPTEQVQSSDLQNQALDRQNTLPKDELAEDEADTLQNNEPAPDATLEPQSTGEVRYYGNGKPDSPLDTQQKSANAIDDAPENFQGGLEENININEETASYESFPVDIERYKKSLLDLPQLDLLTSSFGVRLDPFTHKIAFHGGLDFKGAIGKPVKAALPGKVIHAGKKGRYGNVLIIEHDNGYESRYAHLSKILVKKGDAVEKSDIIGQIGTTGRSTGPHLHFELLKGGKKVNPLTVDLTAKK